MLSLENVSTTIAGIQVLRGISLELVPGTTLAIVGRNGAGKTTLLRLIMGSFSKHEGRVLFDGSDFAKVPARDRAKLGIGYAPEDRVIFPSFSVEQNLRFPLEVTGLSKLQSDARLEETLSIVPELKPMLARSGAALSGGQGKMVALGRAVMVGMRVVLLDEPFQGLAPILAAQYASSLHRLHQARPNLCVVITESNHSLLKSIPHQAHTLERGELQTSQVA